MTILIGCGRPALHRSPFVVVRYLKKGFFMKKQIAILLVIILCLGLCLGLSGCDSPAVNVVSALEIDDHFAGSRTVTVIYPLSSDIDAVKDKIIEDDPTAEADGAAFSYIGVEEDGYYFELKLTFANKSEYEDTVSALIGRHATAFLSRKDTYLTQGTRMAEDFDVSELISWIVRDTMAENATRGLSFAYNDNTVTIGGDAYLTASTVSINDCEGSLINSVSIKTSNDKEGSYDRTFTFSVPNSTYIYDNKAIESYFLSNTAPDAQYSGWSSEGSNMIYTVIYSGLDIDRMAEVTAMLLDTDSVEIFYGDRDNASTPLSEGLTFEESLDTFSFIGPNDGFPKLEYAYSLPTSTTHGDGSVFEDGRWVSEGAWEEGVYKVELTDGSAKLRIPDGIQYAISGINFYLESLGDSRFRRSTEFLYAKTDGYDGMSYADNYFTEKGAESIIGENGENLTCTVVCEGNTEEITSQLVSLFGSGNFMAYQQSEGLFSLTVKTTLTDYVNLGYMLNSSNADRPMTYYVSSDGGDHIVSVSVDGSEIAYTEHDSSSLPITAGCATVEYHGNIPIVSHIVIYVAVGVLLLCLTVFIAIMLLRSKRRRRAADPIDHPEAYDAAAITEESQPEDASAADPLAQTTTFSIFELNALSRNKKYVDEINKDIEERMHAQSLEDQKNDIRAKELEEMSKKVYGTDDQAESTAEQAENEDDGDV